VIPTACREERDTLEESREERERREIKPKEEIKHVGSLEGMFEVI